MKELVACVARTVDPTTSTSTWASAITPCQSLFDAKTCSYGELGFMEIDQTPNNGAGNVRVIYGRILGGCKTPLNYYAIPCGPKSPVKDYGCKPRATRQRSTRTFSHAWRASSLRSRP